VHVLQNYMGNVYIYTAVSLFLPPRIHIHAYRLIYITYIAMNVYLYFFLSITISNKHIYLYMSLKGHLLKTFHSNLLYMDSAAFRKIRVEIPIYISSNLTDVSSSSGEQVCFPHVSFQ